VWRHQNKKDAQLLSEESTALLSYFVSSEQKSQLALTIGEFYLALGGSNEDMGIPLNLLCKKQSTPRPSSTVIPCAQLPHQMPNRLRIGAGLKPEFLG